MKSSLAIELKNIYGRLPMIIKRTAPITSIISFAVSNSVTAVKSPLRYFPTDQSSLRVIFSDGRSPRCETELLWLTGRDATRGCIQTRARAGQPGAGECPCWPARVRLWSNDKTIYLISSGSLRFAAQAFLVLVRPESGETGPDDICDPIAP